MRIYKDIITGDEMFSDTYKLKLVDDVLYEVYGKLIQRKQGDISIAGFNPSAEEADEGTDENVESGVDIVLNHRLVESYAFNDKKSYTLYLKEYMKKLVEKLQTSAPDQVDVFKTNMNKVMKDILGRFKELQFFTGESMEVDDVVEESSNVFLSEHDIPSLNISDVTNYDISTNDIDVDAISILFEDELAPITIRGNVSPKRKNSTNNMININDLSDVNETILGDDLVSITTNEDISEKPTSHEIKCTNDTIIKLMIESVPTTTKGLNNSGVVNVLGDEKFNTEERSVPITKSEDNRSPLKDLNSNQKA
ncbi:hypothetical protein RN001_008387 [Aquatica leii]|uniref:Translationally-controlled tumor protein homolog n=1 Tax=Aquatica leii TaxID=1421715 RepID=A0AAN7PD87_9COLE|nr:hypothetical protein RN001_008387 [Aquatica leii]